MELPDQNIIDTIQSRVVTKEEFNYDHLVARPLYTMISQTDIDEIYKIATSVRLAGNTRKRYELINKVMHNRGFKKLSAGTNRIAYIHYEDPSIVIKVAADKTAIVDNPREFVNQHKLKPFCTKVFEVDPSGTVGVFERVKPITSREEYCTVASNVFEMLDMITSRYVLADIGTKFFMNIGTRKNFGVVLLDFPYLYEINDPNSLVCKKPDLNSPGGFCGGLIDYDEGFNTLRCNKCGAVYRAQELGSYLKTEKIIMKGSGKMNGIKVKVNYRGKTTVNGEKQEEQNIMKEESPVIRPVAVVEKKPENNTNKDGVIRVNVRNGDRNMSYDVDTSTPNKDVTTYNFGMRKVRKPVLGGNSGNNNPKHQNSAPGKKRMQYARFSKLDNSNNLVFTIKTDSGISEILVDPARIPDEIKKVFIPDFDNISTATTELEQAKNDILVVEEINEDLRKRLKAAEEEAQHYKGLYEEIVGNVETTKAEMDEILEKAEALKADRDTKVKILENTINENENLKARIRDLEEQVSSVDMSKYNKKIEELETENAQLQSIVESRKVSLDNFKEELTKADAEIKRLNGLVESGNAILDNYKEEIVKADVENNQLRDIIKQYENGNNTETTSNYVVEEGSSNEEEYDEDGDYVENSIFFVNAVYARLCDIVESTGLDVEYVYEDGTPMDPEISVVAFRDDNGNFMVDSLNNLYVGVNLTPLQIEEAEQEEESEE